MHWNSQSLILFCLHTLGLVKMKPDHRIILRFFSFSGLLFISHLLITAPALANTHEYLLDNGLKLIVKQDHRSPVVVTQVWYKAGSIDEVNGVTGVAHVLEHMMFKGTEKVPNGEFSKKIAAAGGRENAFTSYDYTAYYQQLHKRNLPMAMELESDRMRNLILTEEEFTDLVKPA